MPQTTNITTPIRPVILSGGAGTRLWPVSRLQHPKQFVPLIGDQTLFANTLKRVSDRSVYASPIIVGNAEHKFFIIEALEQLGIKDAAILLEPVGRNTAAAAIIAALHAQDSQSDALHLILPSDHLVKDEAAFHASVAKAAQTAGNGFFTLFGITPDRPETGYGYILPGDETGHSNTNKIARFHEKPDTKGAQDLIKQNALWNSGMFLYSPALLLKEAQHLAPEHYQHCSNAWQEAIPDRNSIIMNQEAYAAMGNHAFDTLIMERTKQGAVLPCSMGWNDVGSWQALWELADKDKNGNAVSGPAVISDVSSSYIRSTGPAIAVLGMQDCMVVATKDAVLVAPHARSQEVKALLSEIESRDSDLATTHTCVPRPWGTYENIARGKNFQVKHIVVKPGRSLSLQMHHHRAEHWIVVAGTARVECGDMEKLVFPNESVFIPQGAKHRLSNPGKVDLQLIEVQSGEYLREDDIIRYDDMYGRVPS